ncbi:MULTISPECIES: CBS domain-containing protein [Streptomyces]|uniref:CBS domain-containing protein n=1 Tax=Streptomyces chengmaiensis TaxID=3040919 RepID=A0ABT6HNF0_9ACTN|nr:MULTISPECIES: CBS domain-containing protein [Streptomyces]MDH2390240.1 CBS domain-containing protein [Streptomyces chengmaiensis]WRQ78082.1 CBS domain-containing protein [Streptomyces sp. MUM 178J]
MTQQVKDVMTAGVAAVRPDASLVEAAQMMRAQDIGGVVVSLDNRLIGVLTDRDIATRAVAEGVDPLAVSAEAVCTLTPVSIGPDEPVSSAVSLMREHAVRRLPVVEGDRPIGMVSLGDLAGTLDPESALGDISRAPSNSSAGPAPG